MEQGFFLVPEGVGDVFTHRRIFEVVDRFVQELEFVGEPVENESVCVCACVCVCVYSECVCYVEILVCACICAAVT